MRIAWVVSWRSSPSYRSGVRVFAPLNAKPMRCTSQRAIRALLGIALVLRLIPSHVLDESRQRAETAFANGRPVSRGAAILIVLLWLTLAALGIFTFISLLHSSGG